MSSTRSRRYALECFEPSNAIKICNGIMLDFYLGLPHMQNKQVRTRGWCMSITITWGSCHDSRQCLHSCTRREWQSLVVWYWSLRLYVREKNYNIKLSLMILKSSPVCAVKELRHKMESKRLTEAVQRNTFHVDLFLATAGIPDRNQTVPLCILWAYIWHIKVLLRAN